MTTSKIKITLIIILYMSFISACSNNTGRYQQKHDSTPSRLPNNSELIDATPRAEAPSRGGNKNYQVRGKHYQVLKSAKNFTQTGIASWYGRKFHGHLTSNGEIYDMYAMSAAHKNLPLPTYLNVVNNKNGRSVIVRVNDRGPFHPSRIIDLSYSAAYKLDMLKTGTANVTITAITDFTADKQVSTSSNVTSTPVSILSPAAPVITSTANDTAINVNQSPKMTSSIATIPSPNVNTDAKYIQVFASKSNIQAAKLANALTSLHQKNTQLEQKNGIFRVLIGPITRSDELASLLITIKESGYKNAFIRK